MPLPTDSTCCLQHLSHSDSLQLAFRSDLVSCSVLQIRHMSGEV